MKEYQLQGKGEIKTYTIIHVAPEDFEEQVPYPVAVIQLEEGPRITAQIVDCPIDQVKIGMKVEATFRRIKEDGYTGAIYYGYKFKPVKTIQKKKASTANTQDMAPLPEAKLRQ
jgi:uncharacterized OB-fold protein